jgi:hypothetical protein
VVLAALNYSVTYNSFVAYTFSQSSTFSFLISTLSLIFLTSLACILFFFVLLHYSQMKAPRVIHGSVKIGPNRWKKLGLVGGGTGVAPLIQVCYVLC